MKTRPRVPLDAFNRSIVLYLTTTSSVTPELYFRAFLLRSFGKVRVQIVSVSLKTAQNVTLYGIAQILSDGVQNRSDVSKIFKVMSVTVIGDYFTLFRQ